MEAREFGLLNKYQENQGIIKIFGNAGEKIFVKEISKAQK
jgi:hypothetical protein